MKGLDAIKARLEASTQHSYGAHSFVLHSPNDMRRLIARVERLETALGDARSFIRGYAWGTTEAWETVEHIDATLEEEDAE